MNTIELAFTALRGAGVVCHRLGDTGVQVNDMQAFITPTFTGYNVKFEAGWYGQLWLKGTGQVAEFQLGHLNSAQARVFARLAAFTSWHESAKKVQLREVVEALGEVNAWMRNELTELAGTIGIKHGKNGSTLFSIGRDGIDEDEWHVMWRLALCIVEHAKTRHPLVSAGPLVGVDAGDHGQLHVSVEPASMSATSHLALYKDDLGGAVKEAVIAAMG